MRKIGLAKNTATELCHGQYFVELDHDDMLTDFALDEIKKAFEANPDVGFVYSNCANFFENGTFHRFDGPDWKNQYRETEYRGKKWLECINHDIYARFGPHFTQQFGWFLTVGPNHVRAYRADQFKKLGGYNPNLPVADDWDLYARFFLFSKCLHIDKMLYLYRFADNWTNTTFVKNQAIQDNLAIGRGHYAKDFEAFNAKRLENDHFLKGITNELVQDAERVKIAKEIAKELLPESEKGTGPCPVGEKGEQGVPGVPESGYNGRSSGDISFVVPEAVPSELTVKCLKSIRENAPGSEIILVANGCEPLPEACKLADKVVRLEMNLRFAAGCNRGAMEATRELICIMNNDAEFVDSSPARLAQAVTKEHPIVAPFSNRAKPPQGDLERMQVPGEHLYPDMVVGVCMVMPAELFRMLGGFDPRLDTYEDDDICYRARSHGFGCKIVGGTYVLHERHATFKALKEDVQAIMVRNGEIFGKKHPKIRVIAIAKNESTAIKDYFEQFSFVTRDWCLLDTGSTDDTVEFAKALGVRVEQGKPISEDHGFADARNEALDRFGKDADWLIMIDPDERLDAHTIRNIKETVFRTPFDIFLSPLRAVSANGETRQFVPKPFLFRSKPEIRWVFKVHEKLIGHKQAIVKNAMIDHILVLHEDGRRNQASGLYDLLAKKEPYFTDPEYKEQMLSKWPILDYDRMDDSRLNKITMGPLISVVIPTFNRHSLLKRAVRSVLTQDYANLEIVMVGDCDPDFEANRNVLDGAPAIRVFNLPKNHGAGGAEPRNYAIMLAAGKFIAYLDDDNEWMSSHVSSVYEAMRERVAAFGFSSMQVEGADLLFKKPEFQGIDTSCVIHRKELIAKYGWWKNRTEANYHHDWEFVSRWVVGGEKWVCTRKPTLLYNAESSGQTAFIKALAEKRANGEKTEPPKTDALTERILDAEKKVEKMVEEANKGKETTRLTIAVPAIASRFNTTLPKVLEALFSQSQGKPVEVKVMLDNKKVTLSEKRNQAIAHARGDFIAFVDDDDRVEPDYVDKLLEAIRGNPDADCIVFDVMVHGYSPEPKLCKYGTEFQEGNGAEAYFRKPNHVMAYKVELAQKYKFVNAYMEEDLVWARQASRDIKKQIRIEKVLYHYLFDPKTTQQGAVREVLFSR
jgi:glycosyltransferase involved in cell wall biosynthesis